jgi:uncharacterized protein YjbI with pentapeptide repeats
MKKEDGKMVARHDNHRVSRKLQGLEAELSSLLCLGDVSNFGRVKGDAIRIGKLISERPCLSWDNISKVIYTDLNLSGLRLDSVKFYGCTMKSLCMEDVVIDGPVRFINCVMMDSNFKQISSTRDHANLIFIRTPLQNSCFEDITLMERETSQRYQTYQEDSGIYFRESSNLRGCNFKRCNLTQLEIRNTFGVEGSRFADDCKIARLSLSGGRNSREELVELYEKAEVAGLNKMVPAEEWLRRKNFS